MTQPFAAGIAAAPSGCLDPLPARLSDCTPSRGSAKGIAFSRPFRGHPCSRFTDTRFFSPCIPLGAYPDQLPEWDTKTKQGCINQRETR